MISSKAIPADFMPPVAATANTEAGPPPQGRPVDPSLPESFAQVIRQRMGARHPSETTASRHPHTARRTREGHGKDETGQNGDGADPSQTGQTAPITSVPLPRQQVSASNNPPGTDSEVAISGPSPQQQVTVSTAAQSTETAPVPPQGINRVAGVVAFDDGQGTSQTDAGHADDLRAASDPAAPPASPSGTADEVSTTGEGRIVDLSPEATRHFDPPAESQQRSGGERRSPAGMPAPIQSGPLPRQQVTGASGTLATDTQATLPQAVNRIWPGVILSDGPQVAKNSDEPVVTHRGDGPSAEGSSRHSEATAEVDLLSSARTESQTAELPVETKPVPDSPEAVASANSVESGVLAERAQVSVPPAGTGSAKQTVGMKLQEKTERNSENAQKIFPRGNYLPDASAPDPVQSAPRVHATSERPGANEESASNSPQLGLLAGVSDPKTVQVESRTLVESVRSLPVERVLSDIRDQVVSFKRIGAESVDVNLQPDRGTEIQLHLSLSDGQVEVAARLQRGDFNSVGAHWSDLQQSLAQQGVRLGHLEHAAFGQHSSQNHDPSTSPKTAQQDAEGQSRRPFGRGPDSPEESPLVSTLTRPLREHATARSGQGWEMWA